MVAVAHTASEAIAALSVHHPDLVLLDIYLPDMTGAELLRLAGTRQIHCAVTTQNSRARKCDLTVVFQ